MGQRTKPITGGFLAAYNRIQDITGLKTQIEISKALGIRQSSVSDAKRRDAVPDGWLVTLCTKYNANPVWILTGKGPRYIVPSHNGAVPAANTIIGNMAVMADTLEGIAADAQILAERMRQAQGKEAA